jgi:transposase
MMNFYNQQHELYCGIDLHSKTLHACVVDDRGEKLLHRNFPCRQAERFFDSLTRFDAKDIVVGCESTFNWYWLADACQQRQLPFILGHALYLKAIHGGKTKSDPIDSEKLARIIRGGNFPLSHVYPKEGRAARDLMRRRTHLVRRRAEALTHIQLVHYQHNLPKPTNIKYKANRTDVGKGLTDPSDLLNVDVDLKMIEALDVQIRRLENFLIKTAKVDDVQSFHRLQTIPGVGPIIALTLMYEIGDLARFRKAGDFLSYSRLVAGSHTSAGKSYGSPGRKIGNPHLRWAFGEAVSLLKRECKAAGDYCQRMEKRHGKSRAMTMLASKLGRAVYYMLRREQAFDAKLMFR